MDVQLIVQNGGKRRQTFHLRETEMIIGRRSGSGLRIPSSEVSRQHCRLFLDNGVLMLEDLNSINGTLLNDIEVSGPEIVRPGDKLQVGPVTFVVEYELSTEALNALEERETDSVEVLVEIDEDADEELLPLEIDDDSEDSEEELVPDFGEDADLPILETTDTNVNEEDLLELLPAEDEESEEDWDLPLEVEEAEEDGPSSWTDAAFEESGPLELPEDKNFRDFLSQLGEDDPE